ncbi:MAG: metal ABC transporter substrate-binding protein [bacterium]
MKKHILILVSLLISIIIFPSNADVLTSIKPYYFLTSSIAGSEMTVKNILPEYSSPHTYSPKPSDIRMMSNAKLIILNGLHLEENLINKLKNDRRAVIIGDSLYENDNFNPHIWLSVDNLKSAALIVKNALVNIDSANASYYEANYELFIDSLMKTDSIIRMERAGYDSIEIITFHNSFYYFLEQYEITAAGTIEEAPGREPSPGHLVKLIGQARLKHIGAVYSEPQLNSKSADIIASELGVEVYEMDPLGNIDEINSISQLLMYNWSMIEKGITDDRSQ